MKSYLLILWMAPFSIGAIAQTENHKIGLSGGFGFQQYYGDLGSGLYKFNTANYGVASVTLGYYLDPSFDIAFAGTIGDYGICQHESVANKEIPLEERCPGCKDRIGKGNLNSRLVTGGVILKYKFANGYVLKKDAEIAPYIYAGIANNQVTDRMKMNCVKPGDYFSINAGVGVKYNLNEKINLGYNIGLGYFQSDKIDLIVKGNNDMYLQNTLFVGINF